MCYIMIFLKMASKEYYKRGATMTYPCVRAHTVQLDESGFINLAIPKAGSKKWAAFPNTTTHSCLICLDGQSVERNRRVNITTFILWHQPNKFLWCCITAQDLVILIWWSLPHVDALPFLLLLVFTSCISFTFSF